jgi:hypothetical protein
MVNKYICMQLFLLVVEAIYVHARRIHDLVETVYQMLRGFSFVLFPISEESRQRCITLYIQRCICLKERERQWESVLKQYIV